ncbi:hypothetical protein ACP275_12G046800 [Erythranthe tilingii]
MALFFLKFFDMFFKISATAIKLPTMLVSFLTIYRHVFIPTSILFNRYIFFVYKYKILGHPYQFLKFSTALLFNFIFVSAVKQYKLPWFGFVCCSSSIAI